MITEHTVLAYVSGSHVTGIEATTGAYLEDFTIDAFVEAHPPPGESGLWRWSGTVAITDDGDAEFAGEWSALWSPDQTCSVPPARITSGLRRRANDCSSLQASVAEVVHGMIRPERKPYRVIIRIEGMLDKGLVVKVPMWRERDAVTLPYQLIGNLNHDQLEPGQRLLGWVNIEADDPEDLFFEALEIAPEPADIDTKGTVP